MKKINIILFLLLLTSFTSFGQKIHKDIRNKAGNLSNPLTQELHRIDGDNWKILSKENYTIKHPPSWEVNTSGEDGTSLILFSPITSKGETFRANINLENYDLENYDLENYDLEKNDINSQTITLKKVTESTLIKIKSFVKTHGGKIISSDLVNVGGISLQKVICNFVGKDGLKLKSEEYILLQNNKTRYRLTFTCQEHKFTDYQATAEKILDSFKML